MGQVALYWPDEAHAHLRYHGYEYLANERFSPRAEDYERIWQQEREEPIVALPKFLKKTIRPFLQEKGYRSYTGMVLLAVENGLVKEWLLDEKEGGLIIDGFLRNPSDKYRPGMKGVHIHDMQGTWSVYESRVLDGDGYYLMQQEGKVGNDFVVLDGQGEVMAKDVAAFDGKVIQTIRKRKKALAERRSKLTAYAERVSEEDDPMRKYPGIPRGELPGREHCGERVSVRARLKEKQGILRRYTMGKN